MCLAGLEIELGKACIRHTVGASRGLRTVEIALAIDEIIVRGWWRRPSCGVYFLGLDNGKGGFMVPITLNRPISAVGSSAKKDIVTKKTGPRSTSYWALGGL